MRLPYLVGGPAHGRNVPCSSSRADTIQTYVGHVGAYSSPIHSYRLTKAGQVEAFVWCGPSSCAYLLSKHLYERAVPEECDDGNNVTLWGYEATLVLKDHTGRRLEMPLPVYFNLGWTDSGIEFLPSKALDAIDRAKMAGEFDV